MKRTLDLEKVTLESGSHRGTERGFCIMEAVAYVAGEKWSDSPACTCPTLAAFMRSWNDSLDDANRQRLKPYVLRLIGTNDGNGDKRGWMALDWLSRVCAPEFMELAGLAAQASNLRGLGEIADPVSLKAAQPALTKASEAAAARAAARAAAAGAAARAKLAPTVARLQESAFDLVERMLALPRVNSNNDEGVPS